MQTTKSLPNYTPLNEDGTATLGGWFKYTPSLKQEIDMSKIKTDGLAYKKIATVAFPAPAPLDMEVNMMPFIMGIKETLPESLHRYWDMIMACTLNKGDVVYLTVRERHLKAGQTQSRTGIHTDGTISPWGGGSKSTKTAKRSPQGQGIFIASNDGRCLVWDCHTWEVDSHGAVKSDALQALSNTPCIETSPSTLYWISDRTPHMALPSQEGIRQFFRLVGPDIGGWWEDHSTPNPIGIKPNAPILKGSKFKKGA